MVTMLQVCDQPWQGRIYFSGAGFSESRFPQPPTCKQECPHFTLKMNIYPWHNRLHYFCSVVINHAQYLVFSLYHVMKVENMICSAAHHVKLSMLHVILSEDTYSFLPVLFFSLHVYIFIIWVQRESEGSCSPQSWRLFFV